MSSFERYAVQRLADQAVAAGIAIPDEVHTIATHIGGCHSYAGTRWAQEHPDQEDPAMCCWGAVNGGTERCTCWEPVYDIEQAEPRPVTAAADIPVQPAMCGDCAFRKDSPERADSYTEDALLDLTNSPTTPFWCHEGMRRPTHWRHPDGRTITGSPDDWQPARLGNIPYRADGQPGLLCAGWAARAARKANPT